MSQTTMEQILARPYQIEMLEKAIEENAIIYLGTGTGKTFIAVNLIKEWQHQISKLNKSFEERKWTIFLAITVPLVYQQAEYLKKFLHLSIKPYFGEMNVDSWEKAKWRSEFDSNEVMVMSPDIFINIIEHDFMRLSQFNLLILDEAHRAVSNHSYRRIMKSYSDLCLSHRSDKFQLPRVLGLTGSVINKKVSLEKIENNIRDLEKTLFAKVVTPPDLKLCSQYKAKPTEYLIEYGEYQVPDFINGLMELINYIVLKAKEVPKSDDVAVPMKPLAIVKAYCNQLTHVITEMGVKMSIMCVEEFMQDLQESLKFNHNEIIKRYCESVSVILVRLKKSLENGQTEQNKYSPKMLRIFELIRHIFRNLREPKVLLFVERRIVASLLHKIIKEEIQDQSDFIRPLVADFVVGTNGEYCATNDTLQNKFTFKAIAGVMKRFREDTVNLLVSTSVLEEGLDVTSCNVIIRADHIREFRSYIQSRGRARRIPSWYFILSSTSDYEKSQENLICYHDIEKILEQVCITRALPSHDESIQHLQDDELEPVKVSECLLSARITMHSCISLLSWYVSTLPCDKFTRLLPRWQSETIQDPIKGTQIVYSLKLPIKSKIKTWVKGDPQCNDGLARRSAALRVCRMLYECGALNDHLLPIVSRKVAPQVTNTLSSVNKNRRGLAIQVPLCFRKGIETRANCVVYPLQLKVLSNRNDARVDDRNANNSPYMLGLVCRHGNIQMPPMTLYSRMGLVEATIGKPIPFEFGNHEERLIFFHHFIFRNVLRISNSYLTVDFQKNSNIMIVPLLKESCQLAEDILHNVWLKKDVNLFQPPSDDERRSMRWNPDLYSDTVVNAWHDPKNLLRFYVNNIVNNMNPLSKISKKSISMVELYKTQYSLDIFHRDWPLIEVSYTTHKLNILSPDTNDTLKAIKSSLHFVPELVNIHPIPSSLWEQLMCLPCCIFRLENIQKVHEFRNLVLQEVGIGKSMAITKTECVPVNTMDLNIKYDQYRGPSSWVLLSCFTTIKAGDSMSLEILEFLGDSFLKYAVSHYVYMTHAAEDEGMMTDARTKFISNSNLVRLSRQKDLSSLIVSRRFDPVRNWLPPGFSYNIPDNVRSGLLDSGVPEDFWDLSKLENYMSASKETISEYIRKAFDERNQTSTKGSSSLNATYLCDVNFVADKTVADSIEALIGCYLNYCGIQAALLFLCWLGIEVMEKKESDSIRTCDAFHSVLTFPDNGIIGPIDHKYSCMISDLQGLEEILKYTFREKSFLVQAVTHSSYSVNETTACLETLEFLGDAVLDYLITTEVFRRDPRLLPGQLTDIRSALVNNTIFGCLAVKWNFHKFLCALSPQLHKAISDFVEYQESNNFMVENYGVFYYSLVEEQEVEEIMESIIVPKSIADLFESLAGAVYLDSRSLETVWRVFGPFLMEFIDEYIKEPPINPKRYLQEIMKSDRVTYYMEAHQDEKIKATVHLWGLKFVGIGPNAKVAKCAAAKGALRYYKKNIEPNGVLN